MPPVRQPLGAIGARRRTLDQTLALRIPSLTRMVLRLGWRFLSTRPPQSRARRWFVRAFARRGIAVLNRRDLDVLRVYVHPAIEAVNTPDLVALGGFERETRGRDEFIAAERRWEDTWERFRYEPTEIIDFGDHQFLLLGRVRAEGGGSGITVDSEWGLLARVVDGLIIREENFLGHAEALEAAGMPG